MNIWVPSVDAKALLISDDEVALNTRLRKIQELSAVGLVDVLFATSAETKSALGSFSTNVSVIVLFTSLEGVEKAVKAGVDIEQLNIGHVPKDKSGSLVHPSVYLGPAQHAAIERLRSLRIDVFIQPLPSDKRICVARRPVSSISTLSQLKTVVVQKSLRVVNERGLHLRAAHGFAHLASTMGSAIFVLHGNGEVNAKSLLGLTTLGASCGAMLKVRAEGPNSADDLMKIEELFASGFDEGVAWVDPENEGDSN
jgi:phosphocarrier protein HPr